MKRPLLAATILVLSSCASPAPEPEAVPEPTLADALTFHASFEEGMDAAYARGDRRIYSAPSYDELADRGPGVWDPTVDIAYDEGVHGHALRFQEKNTKAVFYTAEDNVAFSPDGWRGTISFWLRLDPATDLEPGFCDPIQVTDTAYNDNAIWVDFTDQNPRDFRLGVFGELDEWNPENRPPNENPDFLSRLVMVDEPPFAGDRWTHVVITHEGLGGGEGQATLYLDGTSQGSAEWIPEPFAWDWSTATIRVGVNYVGLFDELAVFDRVLTPEEVVQLGALERGVSELWGP